MWFRFFTPAIATLLFVLAVSPSQAVIVIDDFEVGGFALDTDPGSTDPNFGSQPIGSLFHCIAPERVVQLTSPAGSRAFAQLQFSQIDNEVQTVMEPGQHLQEYTYRPSTPQDLTAVGTHDRIAVFVTVAVPGFRLEVALADDTGVAASQFMVLPGPGLFQFYLSGFVGVDIGSIAEIRVVLDSAEIEGDFHLADIRVRREGHGALKQNVTKEHGDGPSDDPVVADGFDSKPNPDYLHQAMVSIPSAHELGAPTTQIPVVMHAHDSGNNGDVGDVVRIHVSSQIPKADHGDGTYDVYTDFTPGDLRTRNMGDPMMMVPPGANARAFCTRFMVEYFDAAGSVVGTGEYKLVFEVPDGSDLIFTNISTSLNESAASFHTNFDIVHENGTPKQDPGEEIFDVTLTGEYKNNGAPSATPAFANSVEFWAQPSVTSMRSRLHLSRAVDQNAEVLVYSVAGRLVRRLAIPAGTSWVQWDGRDGYGTSVSSGVYMAQLVYGGQRKTTRIVQIR